MFTRYLAIFSLCLLIFSEANASKEEYFFQTDRLGVRSWNVEKDTDIWGPIEAKFQYAWGNLLPLLGENLEERIKDFKQEVYEIREGHSPLYHKVLQMDVYAVVDKEQQDLTGFVVIIPNKDQGRAELAWALAPSKRGQGLGSELLKGLIDFYGQFIGMETKQGMTFQGLGALVNMYNPASLKALSKYMTPYKCTLDDHSFFATMSVTLSWPPLPIEESCQGVDFACLTDKNQTSRLQYVREMQLKFGGKDKWFPVSTRLFIDTFYKHMIHNITAGKRGLPAAPE